MYNCNLVNYRVFFFEFIPKQKTPLNNGQYILMTKSAHYLKIVQ